jgi:hypothetical protein
MDLHVASKCVGAVYTFLSLIRGLHLSPSKPSTGVLGQLERHSCSIHSYKHITSSSCPIPRLKEILPRFHDSFRMTMQKVMHHLPTTVQIL